MKNSELNEKLASSSVLINTRFMLPALKGVEQKVARYLVENPEEVSQSTITEFAEKSGTSESSIVRVCKRLGYSGFSDLKKNLLGEANGDRNRSYYPELTAEDDFESTFRKIANTSIQAIKDTMKVISHEQGQKAVKALSKAGKIGFYGLGDAGYVAKTAQYKFLRLGYQVQAPSDPDEQLISASFLKKDDVAVGISHSGKSETTVSALAHAEQVGATTICITSSPDSPITKEADISLYTASFQSEVGNEVVARRFAESCILESLFMRVMLQNKDEVLPKLELLYGILDRNKV